MFTPSTTNRCSNLTSNLTFPSVGCSSYNKEGQMLRAVVQTKRFLDFWRLHLLNDSHRYKQENSDVGQWQRIYSGREALLPVQQIHRAVVADVCPGRVDTVEDWSAASRRAGWFLRRRRRPVYRPVRVEPSRAGPLGGVGTSPYVI